eukprot:994756-Alexandrium_andersonii.AAC.1
MGGLPARCPTAATSPCGPAAPLARPGSAHRPSGWRSAGRPAWIMREAERARFAAGPCRCAIPPSWAGGRWCPWRPPTGLRYDFVLLAC